MNARKCTSNRRYMYIRKCTRMYIYVYSYLCQKCRYIYVRKCTNVDTCIFVNVQECTYMYIRTRVKNVEIHIFENVQVVFTTKCTGCIFMTRFYMGRDSSLCVARLIHMSPFWFWVWCATPESWRIPFCDMACSYVGREYQFQTKYYTIV